MKLLSPAVAFLFCIQLSFLSAAEAPVEKEGKDARPNIILVMSDDQGWGDVGYNGHPILKTPNLDTAAREGLRFDRFYAAAPSCSPTRASVLTGRNPNRMGVFSWGHAIRPQEVTIAEVLKREGYVTGHFGKWHLGSVKADSPVNPGNNGFDRWVSAPNFYDNNPTMSDQGREVKMKGESSAIAVDAALDWMKDAVKGDAPIFAVIWFGSPHLPYNSDSANETLYSDQRKKMREYLGELTGIDNAYGRLRDSLTEFGIRDNTLLWYTSDNGALRKVGSSGGARGGKHSVYEGGLLVPAVLEWPAVIKEHKSSPVRCTTNDMFPTIMDIVGVPLDNFPVLDGISLMPLITGNVSVRPEPLGFWNVNIPGQFRQSDGIVKKVLPSFENWSDNKIERVTKRVEAVPKQKWPLDVYRGHAAWISGDWKLHRFSMSEGQKVKWELYNLASDPKENHDVSKQYPEIVNELQVDFEAWLKSVVQSLNGEDYQ
ncbi:MAG: N-acetylgalactosamine 6-sulfate sulfatase [Verrucomicrobiales bacterium]|nr:N-acetylgalactosamine 6-sulfate sulfatase [Verrucomicrobiales bacterium]